MFDANVLVSTPDAVRLYRIPGRTIRRWIAEAGIPQHGHAVRPRYTLGDVDAVIQAHKLNH